MKNRTLAGITLIALLLGCGLIAIPTAVIAMGMSFGDDGGAACVAEETPVITPGPLASPLRISVDGDSFLLADYTGALYRVNAGAADSPQLLLETRGKPLSIVQVQGRKRTFYMVGNDRKRTLDVYSSAPRKKARSFFRALVDTSFDVSGTDQLRRVKRLFKKNPVQVLDMAFDADSRKVFLVDGLAAEVKVIKVGGRMVGRFGAFGQLTSPKGIAVDSSGGELFVSDYGDSASGISASIEVFDLDGNHLRSLSGSFSRPQGLAVADGVVYVADAVRGQVIALDSGSGAEVGSYGCFGTTAGHLLLPMDVALNGDGSLYVADNRNGRVTVLPLDR